MQIYIAHLVKVTSNALVTLKVKVVYSC